MKDIELFTLAKLELDRRLFDELKKLGVVQFQSDLGKLCGKNDSYFACMRKKGFGLQLGSLAFLANRLENKAEEELDAERCVKMQLASQIVRKTLNEKCRLKELELQSSL